LLAPASALPTFVATARVPGAVAAGGRSPEPLLDGRCAVSRGVLDLVLRGKRALSPAPVLVEARRGGGRRGRPMRHGKFLEKQISAGLRKGAYQEGRSAR